MFAQGVLQIIQHRRYETFCREYAANRQPNDPPPPKAVWLVSSPNGKWFRFTHNTLITLSLTVFAVVAAFSLYLLHDAVDAALVSLNTATAPNTEDSIALVLANFFRLLSLFTLGLVYFLITPLILLSAVLIAICLSGSLAESPWWMPLLLLLLFPFIKIYTIVVAIPVVAVTVVRRLTHAAYKKDLANTRAVP